MQASELYALPHIFLLPNACLTIVLLSLRELKQSLPTLFCSFLITLSKRHRRIANKGTNKERKIHPTSFLNNSFGKLIHSCLCLPRPFPVPGRILYLLPVHCIYLLCLAEENRSACLAGDQRAIFISPVLI